MDQDQRKRHIRRQNIISALILIVGITLSYLLLGPPSIKSQGSDQQGEQAPAATVRTITLGESDSKAATLEKSALFTSARDAEVVAEYSGIIQKVFIEAGDKVNEGDILAVFEQADSKNAPKVDLETAIETVDLARDSLKKTKELGNENVEVAKNAVDIAEVQLKQAKNGGDKNEIKIAEKQLSNAKDQKDQAEESSELATNSAELQLNLAQGALKLAEVAYEKTIIKSPISGIVVSKSLSEKEYVNSGTSVAQIVGAGLLEAKIYLNRPQMERVSVGDEVDIELSGSSHKGKIASLSPIATSGNERFEVKITTDEEIYREANRSAKIFLSLRLASQLPNSFFVPLDALSIGQQKNTLFVVENGKAVLREVKVGQIIGAEAEVTEGLASGEQVVIQNSRNLQDGQRVQIEK